MNPGELEDKDEFDPEAEVDHAQWLWDEIAGLHDSWLTIQPIPRPPTHKEDQIRWWNNVSDALATISAKCKAVAEGREPGLEDIDDETINNLERPHYPDPDEITPEDLPHA